MKLYYYLDLPQIRTCFLSWEQRTMRSLTLNVLDIYIGAYQITASDLQIMPSQCWLRASTESPASGSAFCRGVETTQPAAGLIAWGWQTAYSLKNQDGRLRFWSNLFRVMTVRICFRDFPYANVCEIGSTSNWICQVILGTMRHLLDQEHAQQCQESQGGWTPKMGFSHPQMAMLRANILTNFEKVLYKLWTYRWYPVFIQIHIKRGLTLVVHNSQCNMYRIIYYII